MQKKLIDILLERALFVLVIFCVLVGSIVAGVNSETLKLMPLPKRLATQFAGFLFITLINGFLVDTYKWNPYLLCAIGLGLGMVSVQFIIWIGKIIDRSNSFPEFLSELTRVARAFWKAYNDIKPPKKEENDLPAN